jgi:hypothetical protein
MRSMGKVPSRVDLASFFSAVHHVKPLPETKGVDLHDLDVSTRPDLFGNRKTQVYVTVRPKYPPPPPPPLSPGLNVVKLTVLKSEFLRSDESSK